ncbi:MAG: hypothetical protein M0Q13_13605 [Methanothrix sp.]|jgi:hypothetical protein|nr:hypothetical protein [Methanothrix sp.]
MEEDKLKEGTKIIYNSDNISIYGEIVGLADNGNPIIGFTYIIKILEVEGEIDYKYSCIALPRVFFNVIDYCWRCKGMAFLTFDTDNGWHDKCPDCNI